MYYCNHEKKAYQNVMIITTPRTPLKKVAIIMARGSCNDASFSSSYKSQFN